MKNLCLWALVSLCGIGLIFDGQIRNDYYTAFSYLFPANTKQYQDLADTTRLVVGLAMTLSFLNLFSGIMFKLISMVGLVVYSVVINQEFILNPSLENREQICSIAIHITLIFICMDSIINKIIVQETQAEKERTKKAIQAAKQKAAKTVEESHKAKSEKVNPTSGKSKTSEQSKTDKKSAKNQQKAKNT